VQPAALMKKNRWQDHYALQAKKKGWLARSIFKLEELDSKYHLLHQGDRVLDLGCYPGSWIQYSLKKVGSKGEVIGIDLNKPKSLNAPNFRFVKADVLKVPLEWLDTHIGRVNVVLSDLAPRTTGVKSADAARSMELAQRAFEIASRLLERNGAFVCKVFEGQGLQEFRSEISGHFTTIRAIRPKAVRKGSREIYLIAQGKIFS